MGNRGCFESNLMQKYALDHKHPENLDHHRFFYQIE